MTAEIEALPPEDFTREELQELLLPAGAARNAVGLRDVGSWKPKSARQIWFGSWRGWPKPGPEITAYTLSLDTPREDASNKLRENAHRPLAENQTRHARTTCPVWKLCDAGAPDATIIVDANEGWSAEVYADLAPHLVRLGVTLWSSNLLPAG